MIFLLNESRIYQRKYQKKYDDKIKEINQNENRTVIDKPSTNDKPFQIIENNGKNQPPKKNSGCC